MTFKLGCTHDYVYTNCVSYCQPIYIRGVPSMLGASDIIYCGTVEIAEILKSDILTSKNVAQNIP